MIDTWMYHTTRFFFFFFKHILFWRSGSDMLSQNLGGSNYASVMLILVCLRVQPSSIYACMVGRGSC